MEILVKILGACLYLAIPLSLIMPRRLGFFLSNPTRLKVFGVYFIGAIAITVVMQALYGPATTKMPMPVKPALTDSLLAEQAAPPAQKKRGPQGPEK